MLSADCENDMVECPYNKAHRMLRKRLQSHILKCRLNHPNAELRKCPFNQTHLIPEPEFVLHVTNCSDRKLITQYKYNAPEEEKEEERIKHEPIECEENWDDTEVEDYNPKKYIETANVLRRPEGTLPAQRKAFIKKERKRLGDYDSEDEVEEKRRIKVKREELTSDVDDFARRDITPPPPPHMLSTTWENSGYSRRSRSNSFERISRDIYNAPRVRDHEYRDYMEYREYRDYRERLPPRRSSPRRSPLRLSPPRRSPLRLSPPRRSPLRLSSPRRSPLRLSSPRRSPPLRSPPRSPLLHHHSPRVSKRYSPSLDQRRKSQDYDLDDDPYYNGGGSVSHRDVDVYSSSSSISRARPEVSYQNPYERYAVPPVELSPPMRSYYAPVGGYVRGRGSHRGHPYMGAMRTRYDMAFYEY